MTNNLQSTVLQKILFIAATLIIIAGLKAAHSILVPVLLALFISIVCIQPIMFLEKYKVPSFLAIIVVLTGLALMLFVIGGFVTHSLTHFVNDLPKYDKKLQQVFIPYIQQLNGIGIEINTQTFLHVLDPSQVLNYTAKTIGKASKVLSSSFIIFLLVIFMLFEMHTLALKVKSLSKFSHQSDQYLGRIGSSIRHYLSIKTYISIITGTLIAGALSILGVDYPVLWGLIAFALNYIPSIGSILAAIPALLFILVQLGPGKALIAALSYLVVNIILGNLIEPKIMGNGLGLSTLTVFLSLIFWGFVLGTVGMFLAIPITISLKIILEQSPKTKWFAILLGTQEEARQVLSKQN